jgi:iron complex transport system substrate-binding protein
MESRDTCFEQFFCPVNVSRQNIRGGHGIFKALSFFDERQGLFYFGFSILDFGLKSVFRRELRTCLVILLLAVGLTVSCRTAEVRHGNVATREVRDDLGRTVHLPQKIERAISLAPSLTESIFAVGAGDRLVGVTTYCNYPPGAASIEKIGDTQTPNIEKIVALKPQIVFVSTASQLEAFFRTLDEQGIAVYVTNPTGLEGVLNNLSQLGELFGTKDIAETVVGSLRNRVANVDNDVAGRPRVRVFVQISRSPLFTIGRTSFLTEIVERAGGMSVTSNVEKAYPEFSKETALALNPEAIILSESDDNREPNDVFSNSDAVKTGRVIRINADLLSRPSPRLVDALEQISSQLHSEKSSE